MPGPRGCMVICEACALRYCCRCHLSAVDNPWGEGIYGLNEREDEAINEKHVMENVKASQALKQKCTNENFEVIDLDELLNHLNAVSRSAQARNKLLIAKQMAAALDIRMVFCMSLGMCTGPRMNMHMMGRLL